MVGNDVVVGYKDASVLSCVCSSTRFANGQQLVASANAPGYPVRSVAVPASWHNIRRRPASTVGRRAMPRSRSPHADPVQYSGR
ncbi:unnamed protein product [Parajaminaea phylloscopi]